MTTTASFTKEEGDYWYNRQLFATMSKSDFIQLFNQTISTMSKTQNAARYVVEHYKKTENLPHCFPAYGRYDAYMKCWEYLEENTIYNFDMEMDILRDIALEEYEELVTVLDKNYVLSMREIVDMLVNNMFKNDTLWIVNED